MRQERYNLTSFVTLCMKANANEAIGFNALLGEKGERAIVYAGSLILTDTNLIYSLQLSFMASFLFARVVTIKRNGRN